MNNYKRLIVIVFFILYFLLGVLIFRDYGIAWDDHFSRLNGLMAYDYVTGKSSDLLRYVDRDYGTAFELPLVMVEKVLNMKSTQQIFFMRHFLTFVLFFVGTIFFYKLATRRFGTWFALLGVVFLVLSPRIFADSFYNSKDVGLLAALTIGFFTLIKFLEKPSLKRAIIHAVVCAFIVDLRMPGIIIVPLTLGFFLFESFFINKTNLLQRIKILIAFFLTFSFLTILFWPYLWSNPFGHFWESYTNLSRFVRFDDLVLYLGEYINATKLSWHYTPVWIAISTPLIYLALFLTGTVAIVVRLIRNYRDFYKKYRDDLIFIVWFFIPLFSVLILNSVVYDGWRQLYFIYPPFILIGLIGIEGFLDLVKKFKKRKIILGIVSGLLILNLVGVLFFMLFYHPYQNLYFNFLAGGMKNAKQNFELDYWGLTFREGLEYVASKDSSKGIPVFFAHGHMGNVDILKESDKARFVPLAEPQGAKYILTNYRWHKEDYPSDVNEVYNVFIQGVKVMTVFKFY